MKGAFMDGDGLIYTIVVGIVAGWLAGVLMKSKKYGILGNLIVGIIGAFIGSFVFGLLGIGGSGIVWSIVSATAGACLLVFILSKMK